MTREAAENTSCKTIAPGITIEDVGDGFYLTLEGDGHDLTLSLDDPLAITIAQYITERARKRGFGEAARN